MKALYLIFTIISYFSFQCSSIDDSGQKTLVEPPSDTTIISLASESLVLRYRNEFGDELVPGMKNIKFISDTDQLFFEYSVNIGALPYILRKGENVEFVERDGFLWAETEDSVRNGELKFVNYYIQNKKEGAQGFIFQRAEWGDETYKNPWLRNDKFLKHYREDLAFLDTYKDETGLSDEFYHEYEAFFRFKALEKQVYFNPKALKEVSSDYKADILKLIDSVQSDKFIHLVQYRRTISSLCNLAIYQSLGKEYNQQSGLERYNFYTENLRGKTSWLEKMRIIDDFFTREAYVLTEEDKNLIEVFVRDCPYPEYRRYISGLTLKSGLNTSGLQVEDTKENSLDLDEILSKSKINYVDFWASWCGPCIAEMPASAVLKKEYQEKGIQFVYISIDVNHPKWLTASKRYDLTDSFIELNKNISRKFDIVSIPRYMIFDDNGEILMNNAPRPSDPKLREVMDGYLRE